MISDSKIAPFPHRIVIELTPQCNLSCSMCPRHYINEINGFMPKELWMKLIDEISKASPEAIVLPFWRGESLLHPDFIELMKYALDKSLRIHISTNGHLVTGECAEILALCEFVTFSIHTPLGYSRAKEFLKLRNGSKPIIQVSFIKGEKTTEKVLAEIINTAYLGGFDSVRLYDEHTKDGVFGKSGHSLINPRTFCPKLNDTLVIACDGKVSRCNHIWETERGIDLNNLSIKDAWASNSLQKIRDGYPDSHCAPCDQWTGHTCGESWRIGDGKIEHKMFGPAGILND
ncbi:MAG: radical SAM/SPASM domain-containing protein [Nitrospirota bacterium]